MADENKMYLEIETLINKSLLEQTNKIVDAVGERAKKAEKSIQGMSGAFKAVAAAAVAGFTGDKLKKGLDLASDATESRNKLEAVFGEIINDADNFINGMAEELKLGKNQLTQEMADIAAMTKGMGFDDKRMQQNTQNVMKMAKDMASFYNVELSSAIHKITSGMTGETEALKALGITIQDADMDEYAESLGYAWKNLNNTEKAQLRLNLIMKKMKDAGAVGDAIKTANEYANVERQIASLSETMTSDLFMGIKDAVLPVMVLLRDYLDENKDSARAVGESIGDFVSTVIQGAKSVKSFLDENEKLVAVGLEVAKVVGIGIVASQTALGVIELWTKAQTVFNAVMAANPIGLVAGAVAMLAYGVYKAYENFEPFRETVDITWESMKELWGVIQSFDMGNFFESSCNVAAASFDVFKNGVNSVFTLVSEFWKFLTGHDIGAVVGKWFDKVGQVAGKIRSLIPGFGKDEEIGITENISTENKIKNIVEEDTTKNVKENVDRVVKDDLMKESNKVEEKAKISLKISEIKTEEISKKSLNETRESKQEFEFKYDIKVNSNIQELTETLNVNVKTVVDETIENYNRKQALNLGIA